MSVVDTQLSASCTTPLRLRCNVLCCIVLNRNVLYGIVLHCTVPFRAVARTKKLNICLRLKDLIGDFRAAHGLPYERVVKIVFARFYLT